MTLFLFAGVTHYPNGGIEDFVCLCEDMVDAERIVIERAEHELWQWAQVGEHMRWDGTFKMIARWSNGEHGWRSCGALDSAVFSGWQYL